MSEPAFSLPGWSNWLKDSSFVAAKIGDVDEANVRDQFARVHAASEAMLRQVLFVGFRLNRAAYAQTNEWLYHNDVTPDRKKFPALFDTLFKGGMTWDEVIRSQPDLDEIWALWLDFAKVVRNHVQHGVRKHDDNALRNATLIDQALMIRLDMALFPVIGGHVAGTLTAFSPRLPKGAAGLDLTKLAGLKRTGSRPTPAADVRQRMGAIQMFVAVSTPAVHQPSE